MSLKNHSLEGDQAPARPAKGAPPAAVAALLPSIKALAEDDLVALRRQIDLLLELDLGNLNLANELALQYRQARNLMNEIQDDDSVPANQKSQIFNSIRATLADIVKQQEIVWSAERSKTFEVAFVKAAGLLTADARIAFFDLYGKYLKDPAHDADAAQADV